MSMLNETDDRSMIQFSDELRKMFIAHYSAHSARFSITDAGVHQAINFTVDGQPIPGVSINVSQSIRNMTEMAGMRSGSRPWAIDVPDIMTKIGEQTDKIIDDMLRIISASRPQITADDLFMVIGPCNYFRAGGLIPQDIITLNLGIAIAHDTDFFIAYQKTPINNNSTPEIGVRVHKLHNPRTIPFQASAASTISTTASLEDLFMWFRRRGWRVAVHNDYKQDGEWYTFYLFTHQSGVWAKGEGVDDKSALLEAQKQAESQQLSE